MGSGTSSCSTGSRNASDADLEQVSTSRDAAATPAKAQASNEQGYSTAIQIPPSEAPVLEFAVGEAAMSVEMPLDVGSVEQLAAQRGGEEAANGQHRSSSLLLNLPGQGSERGPRAAWYEQMDGVEIVVLELLGRSRAERVKNDCREASKETILQLFMMKVLYTVAAWFIETVLTDLISLIYSVAAGTSTANLDSFQNMIIKFIYIFVLCMCAPCLQYLLRNVRNVSPDHRHAKFLYSVILFKSAIPMTLAWAFKNGVDSFLTYMGDTLVCELITAAVILVLVVVLQATPQVRRAQKEVNENKDGIIKRYMCLPSSLLLSLAYSVNLLARYGITELKTHAESMNKSKAALGVIVQVVYYQVTLTIAIHITAWWERRSKGQRRQQAHDHEIHAKALAEAEADVGDVLVHTLSFLVGWSLSDFLDTVYYPFFLSLPSRNTASFQQVWLFAIFVSVLLFWYVQHLGNCKSARPADATYKVLMKTALALTVGWAWQNVCSATTGAFVLDFETAAPNFDAAPLVISFVSGVLCWYVMAQMLAAVGTEIAQAKRQREEYNEAHPTEFATDTMAEAVAVVQKARERASSC